MAAITLKCPECDLTLKVAEDKIGKKIRCKECEHVFVAREPAKTSAKTPAKADKNKAVTTKPAEKAKAKPEAKPAPKPEPKPEAKPSPGMDEDDGPIRYGVNEEHLTARCPECANEMESEEAVVCLHCGFNTQTRTRATRKVVKEPSGGEVFLWLLPGIGCVLGIIVGLVFVILHTVKSTEWFLDAWYEFLSYAPFKLWAWIVYLFAAFYLGRFAVKRLLINNMPPEEEVKE